MRKWNRGIAVGMILALLLGNVGQLTVSGARGNEDTAAIIGVMGARQDIMNTEAMELVDRLVLPDVTPSVREEIDEDTGIRHSGIAVTGEQLDTMQQMVRAKQEPWLSAFQKFTVTTSNGNTTRAISEDPRIYWQDWFVNVPGGQDGNFVGVRARWDADTALRQIIMWYITGRQVYRQNAIKIIRLYSQMESAVDHWDSQIIWGSAVFKFCTAAEIIKYSSCEDDAWNWSQEDEKAFLNMLELTEQFYNRYWHWMNQHTFCTLGTMAAAIFRNDPEMYETAVERTTVNALGEEGGRNGSIKQQVRSISRDLFTGEYYEEPNIQLVEMGRDVAHAYDSINGLGQLAQLIYNQGTKVDPVTGTASSAEDAVDAFDFLDRRILKGANYICKYNLGYDVTYVPCTTNGTGTEYYTEINKYGGRSRLDAGFGVIYNHYKYIEKMDMNTEETRYLARAYETIVPETDSTEFTGSASLLYTPAEAAEEAIPYYQSYTNGDNRGEAENASAVLKGQVSVESEGDTAFVRANANHGGSCYAIRDGIVSADPIVTLRVRSDGNAVIGYTSLEADRKPICEFQTGDTGGAWTMITCNITGKENANDSALAYLTIQGEAETVDVDYLLYSETTTETTAEETDSRKVIHYAARDLAQAGNNQQKVGFDEEYQIPEIVPVSSWGSGIQFYLPVENSSNLVNVTVNLRATETDSERGQGNRLALYYKKNGLESRAGIGYTIKTGSWDAYADAVLYSSSSPGEFEGAEELYLQWGPEAYGGVYLRQITMTYAKTEADQALDAAVAQADALENRSDELEDCLAEAKEYKISTASQLQNAMEASQEQIAEAAQELNRLMELESVSVQEMDSAVGTLSDRLITVAPGTTAAGLKEAILSTVPESSSKTVFTDEKKTQEVPDDAQLETGNVLVVEKTGYAYSRYTIVLDKEPEFVATEAEETDDKKIVHYAAADLMNLYGNVSEQNGCICYDDVNKVDRVISLAGWNTSKSFYLPDTNCRQIQSVSINARAAYTASGRNNVMTLHYSNDKESDNVTGISYGINVSDASDYRDYQMSTYMLEEVMQTADRIWLLWGPAYGEAMVKTITVTYTKSNADRELDAVIARAEAMDRKSSSLLQALEEAEQYKVTTADDIIQAADADEESVQSAVDKLKQAISAEKPDGKGDINEDGKVDVNDVTMALAFACREKTPTDRQLECGDLNGDLRITAVDALLILKEAVK